MWAMFVAEKNVDRAQIWLVSIFACVLFLSEKGGGFFKKKNRACENGLVVAWRKQGELYGFKDPRGFYWLGKAAARSGDGRFRFCSFCW
jgi:hypothetical protein